MTVSEQIESLKGTPLFYGDKVLVKKSIFDDCSWSSSNETYLCTVERNEKDGKVLVKHYEKEKTLDVNDCTRYTFDIGYNPFKTRSKSRSLAFDLGVIIHVLDLGDRVSERITKNKQGEKIKELNWNPHVIDKNGNKIYYQRDLVWSLEEKQEFLESIYKGIGSGNIVIRKNNVNEVIDESDAGNSEICFNDVVDGKQRLHTIDEFITNKFCDKNGMYWRDFSGLSKHKFSSYRGLSYFELDEDTTDKEAINEFMMVNFAGVKQTKEHMKFVESIKI